MMKKAMLAVGLLGAATVADAASSTATFTVGATVISSCSMSAGNMVFGNYDPLAATDKTGTSTINVQCSLGAAYAVGLNAGTASGATVTTRTMADSGSHSLSYKLESVVGVTNWGNVGSERVSGVGTGLSVPLTVFGTIPKNQNATVGDYSDLITVTITY